MTLRLNLTRLITNIPLGAHTPSLLPLKNHSVYFTHIEEINFNLTFPNLSDENFLHVKGKPFCNFLFINSYNLDLIKLKIYPMLHISENFPTIYRLNKSHC